MIYTHAFAAILSAALAFAGAWQVQEWRWKSNTQQSAIESIREARKIESARSTHLTEALNEQVRRTKKHAADAALARSELERLRGDIAAITARLPSPAACPGIEPAATGAELLAECSAALEDMARAADGHASDALMLQQAWPKH